MLEKRFTEAPTIYQIKHFLEYFALARVGILEKQITDTTLLNRFNNLKRAIKLHTNHQYNCTQNKEVIQFVRKGLVPRGLVSTCARPKPNAPIPVAEDLVRFLFACDEYKELHSRIRVQMAFAIQLMSCVGVRPGEVVESDAWYQSNEGLLYKDVDLLYFTEPQPEWRLHIKLRNRKGHREYKKHAYVVSCSF
jgi:integrase